MNVHPLIRGELVRLREQEIRRAVANRPAEVSPRRAPFRLDSIVQAILSMLR